MANQNTFVIKGVRDGLLVHLNTEEDWTVQVKRLVAHIDEQTTFFRGARLALDVGARSIRKHELGALQAMLEKRGVTLWAVLSESITTLGAARKLGLSTTLTPPAPPAPSDAQDGSAVAESLLRVEQDAPPPINPDEAGTQGVLVRRTLRSGRSVHSGGHVVVLGDVNPGAEIVAGGDVIVWGRLRGIVHAGAHGDESAVVCALDMSPTQLRIAGYIATSPKEARGRPVPETAMVREQRIVVEAWT